MNLLQQNHARAKPQQWLACAQEACWSMVRLAPLRQSVQAAEEDSRSLDEASAVSVEALRERCRNLATTNVQEKMPTVERRSTGWRLRSGTKSDRRYGPHEKG